MSRICEVYLWRVIGKNIRNNSGNYHIVGIDQIMMSPIELLKCCYQFVFWIPLAQQFCSEYFPTLHEVLIIWTGSGIMDYMWTVNAVCWCRRDITAQEWKVNNRKIEDIPSVVKPSSKLSIVNVEITVQVWRGGCSLRCFLYFKLTCINGDLVFDPSDNFWTWPKKNMKTIILSKRNYDHSKNVTYRVLTRFSFDFA